MTEKGKLLKKVIQKIAPIHKDSILYEGMTENFLHHQASMLVRCGIYQMSTEKLKTILAN